MNPARGPSARDCLTDRQFHAIADIIQGQVGIQLPAAKRSMVEGRLRKRARALGLQSLDQYGRTLFEEGRIAQELAHLIDCVTTNTTDFFREPAHFDFLRGTAVPTLLKGGRRNRLKIWSAACSIGAEAYTSAMVLAALKRSGLPFEFSILGTDISTEVLEKARAGIYPDAMMEPVPEDLRRLYVMTNRDPVRGEVRIAPEIRRLVQFHPLNLMQPTYPFDQDVDVIFCRNVLIYFDKPTQRAVLDRLVSHLRPGGYLMIGHAETMAGNACARLRQVLPTVYRA